MLFNPSVDFLQKRKVPRALAVIFIYVGAFGLLSLVIFLITPIFIAEIQAFLTNFPEYFDKIAPPLKGLGIEAFANMETFLGVLGTTLEGMSESIFSALFSVFGGMFATLFVVVTAIFLSLEEGEMQRALVLLFPKNYEAQVMNVWSRCQKKVSGWFGARILA